MKNRNRNKKSGSGFIIFLIIIIVIAMVIAVLCALNPLKFENTVNDIKEKLSTCVSGLGDIGILKPEEENIVLPEVENLTGRQKYYFYQQLSEPAKKIYVTIENNIDKIKNGEDNIKLPSSLNDLAKSNENGKQLVADEFQKAWDAFVTDRQEYFYIDSSKVCLVTKMTTKGSNVSYEFYIGKGDNPTYFTDNFKSKEEVDEVLEELEEIKEEILEEAEGNNYDKLLYLHDYIVENTKYDNNNTTNNSNIYGCLCNGTAICEGYARAYKYLLDELEIPCILVSGIAVDEYGKSERHAWNYVYIKNAWYAVDTTWDDPIIIGNGKITDAIKYKYFLKGKTMMNKDHTPSGQITKNGYEFEYPELSYNDIK